MHIFAWSPLLWASKPFFWGAATRTPSKTGTQNLKVNNKRMSRIQKYAFVVKDVFVTSTSVLFFHWISPLTMMDFTSAI